MEVQAQGWTDGLGPGEFEGYCVQNVREDTNDKDDDRHCAGRGLRDRLSECAILPVASDHHPCSARRRRIDRYDRAHHGRRHAARSAPDGYLVQIGQWGTNVAGGAVYDLPIDLLKDLEPVGLISTQPFMIVGKKTLPPNNFKELIAWLKANPGATFGNAGIGSPGHVSSIFFQNTIGAKIQPVPYRSAGPASQDLIAGNIDLMMDTAATSGPHVRSGLLKAYAMSSNKRSLAMPDVPTVDEAGLPGFYFYFWHALWVPKGTPKDVIAKLNDALVKARNDPATHKRLEDIGQEFFPSDMETPEGLAKFQKEEIDKWWPVIKAAGIKAQ